MNKFSGRLIALEGIDGSGKTVLSQFLCEKLFSLGKEFVLTKEPGGTNLGQELRKILQYRQNPLTSKSEYLLFAADRAQHFSELIVPNLEAGKIVISDRMGDSSVVYQGYGRGLDIDMIKNINSWAMDGNNPDLVIYVRVSPEIAIERIISRAEELTAFEKEKREFVNAIAAGYDDLLIGRDNVLVLDGEQSSEQLADECVAAIVKLFEVV